MLITDKFVMLNFPKTGSTFARESLGKVHHPPRFMRGLQRLGIVPPRMVELKMLPWFFTPEQAAVGSVSQHGTYNQIPAKHRSKAVVTVVRDPLTRLVSLYEYRDWQRRVMPGIEIMQQRFPRFPDLTFEEFLDMQQFSLAHVQPPGLHVHMGPLTTQFIRFYARDPLKTILALREDSDLKKDYDLHFPKIHFLHTENLNQELYDLLLTFGYPPSKLAFIQEKEKINTSKRSRKAYYTPELRERVLHSERFYYQLFPEYLPTHA